MSKLMEDRLNESTYNRNIQIVIDMLTDGGYSYEQITKLSRLTLPEIKEIEKEIESSKAQQQ